MLLFCWQQDRLSLSYQSSRSLHHFEKWWPDFSGYSDDELMPKFYPTNSNCCGLPPQPYSAGSAVRHLWCLSLSLSLSLFHVTLVNQTCSRSSLFMVRCDTWRQFPGVDAGWHRDGRVHFSRLAHLRSTKLRTQSTL